MEPIITYILEQLTVDTVNVIFVTSIQLNGKTYEIERSRTCFGNSPMGRQSVTEQLPEQYANAILELWGDEPTLTDPQPEQISE